MMQISGTVIHGEHFGKILGFPTANLDRREYVRKKMKIKLGVWAGVAEAIGLQKKAGRWPALHRGRTFKAAIVIGPIDRFGLPKIEAHFIGFKGNLYDRKIILVLNKYLRPFKKFKNAEELKRQIKKDIKRIKKLK